MGSPGQSIHQQWSMYGRDGIKFQGDD